jgi:hypothetical protein
MRNFIFSPNDSRLNDDIILILVIRLWIVGVEIFKLLYSTLDTTPAMHPQSWGKKTG